MPNFTSGAIVRTTEHFAGFLWMQLKEWDSREGSGSRVKISAIESRAHPLGPDRILSKALRISQRSGNLPSGASVVAAFTKTSAQKIINDCCANITSHWREHSEYRYKNAESGRSKAWAF
jgi:hypothetical protein